MAGRSSMSIDLARGWYIERYTIKMKIGDDFLKNTKIFLAPSIEPW
jgi:hypothetical protein